MNDVTELIVLPCTHRFHKRCISPWFIQQGRNGCTCPNCRAVVEPNSKDVARLCNSVCYECKQRDTTPKSLIRYNDNNGHHIASVHPSCVRFFISYVDGAPIKIRLIGPNHILVELDQPNVHADLYSALATQRYALTVQRDQRKLHIKWSRPAVLAKTAPKWSDTLTQALRRIRAPRRRPVITCLGALCGQQKGVTPSDLAMDDPLEHDVKTVIQWMDNMERSTPYLISTSRSSRGGGKARRRRAVK
jgi:hypothetical protein